MKTKFKFGSFAKANTEEVVCCKLTAHYTQCADTCSASDEDQEIIISTQLNGATNEPYFDIEIPDGHWSITEVNELIDIVEDFKARISTIKPD